MRAPSSCAWFGELLIAAPKRPYRMPYAGDDPYVRAFENERPGLRALVGPGFGTESARPKA